MAEEDEGRRETTRAAIDCDGINSEKRKSVFLSGTTIWTFF